MILFFNIVRPIMEFTRRRRQTEGIGTGGAQGERGDQADRLGLTNWDTLGPTDWDTKCGNIGIDSRTCPATTIYRPLGCHPWNDLSVGSGGGWLSTG
jgi:hypothetical protein